MTNTLFAGLVLSLLAATAPAADTVATAVYARVGNGYKRDKAQDGSFKPEYFALTNGGRIAGTVSDITVDQVSYPEVAEIAKRLLAEQNYHYAQTTEQAKLLIVLNWGSTLAPNGERKEMNIANAQTALATLGLMQDVVRNNPEKQTVGPGGFLSYPGEDVAGGTASGFGPGPYSRRADNEVMAVQNSAGSVETSLFQSLGDDQVRDQLNAANARVLGYMDDLADSNDIRRHAGGGNRYNDLITEVEESRYYIVISAYDFPTLLKSQKRKLLWQTRVSVRSPGNNFNESYLAMLKSAAPYFGRDSGKLVRGEEAKGTVELGELKYLGLINELAREPANGDQSEEEQGDLSEGEEPDDETGQTEESEEEGFQSMTPSLQK